MSSITGSDGDGPFVQGTSLRRVAAGSGPFLTAYLPSPSDDDGGETGESELADIAAANSEASRLMPLLTKAIQDHQPADDTEATAYVVSEESVDTFEFSDPIRRPLCRVGRYPSLGPILEEHQLVASHVVVIVENGRFAVTTFGSRAVPDAPPRSLGVAESIETLIEELRFAPPRLIALAGELDLLDSLAESLQENFPIVRVDLYPLIDIDEELADLADDVVRDAATVAAEDVAHELGAFRAAEAEGLAVAGPAVMGALQRGEAVAVLVHDDIDDIRTVGADRLVDAVVATALATNVRITMMPNIDERRGPAGGLGAIVGGRPQAAALGVEHVDLTSREESVPQSGTVSA